MNEMKRTQDREARHALGVRMAAALNAGRLELADVVKATGCGPTTVLSWGAGLAIPQVRTGRRLARLLDARGL